MEVTMQDVIYIVNELGDYFKVNYKGKQYIFLAGKPVRIDYSEDPSILSYLLQFVTLRVMTVKELDSSKIGMTNQGVKNEKSYRYDPNSKPKSN
jgi:hypothetical protein